MHFFYTHWHAMKLKKRRKKKNQKQRKQKQRNSSLPQEIITNILKRLPVKSLIGCQCVCKSWRNLMKTQYFIDEHLHHSSNQNTCLLFAEYFPFLDSTHLYMLNNDMKVVEFDFASMFDLLLCSVIMDSINGLLFFKLRNPSYPFLVWNPAIRQFRLVPKPAKHYSFRLGFGFSSIVNDYYILTIDGMKGAEVYSLKRGSWKEVESSLLKDVTILNQSLGANGNIFWVGIKYNVHEDTKNHVYLVSYDMALEVFKLIPLHILSIGAFDLHSTRLAIHENKLALISHIYIGDPLSSLIDLWVIEEGTGQFEERYSWTKKFSIRRPSLSIALTTWRNKMVCLPCLPLFIGVIGDTMSCDEIKSIGLVDLTTSEVSMCDICMKDMPYPFLNYVESLVPVSNNYIQYIQEF